MIASMASSDGRSINHYAGGCTQASHFLGDLTRVKFRSTTQMHSADVIAAGSRTFSFSTLKHLDQYPSFQYY